MINEYIKNNLKERIKLREKSKRIKLYKVTGLIQTYNKVKDSIVPYKNLSPSQKKSFKVIFHGNGGYTKEEYNNLASRDKVKVTKLWRRSQRLVNNYKNVVSNFYGNMIFSNFSALDFITTLPCSHVDNTIININNLKELDIDYDDIILLYIKNNLLPVDFYINK